MAAAIAYDKAGAAEFNHLTLRALAYRFFIAHAHCVAVWAVEDHLQNQAHARNPGDPYSAEYELMCLYMDDPGLHLAIHRRNIFYGNQVLLLAQAIDQCQKHIALHNELTHQPARPTAPVAQRISNALRNNQTQSATRSAATGAAPPLPPNRPHLWRNAQRATQQSNPPRPGPRLPGHLARPASGRPPSRWRHSTPTPHPLG